MSYFTAPISWPRVEWIYAISPWTCSGATLRLRAVSFLNYKLYMPNYGAKLMLL